MIPNFVLLTGTDTYRLKAKVRFFKEHFQVKFPEGNVEYYDEKSDFDELENSILTPSLFGGKKLVIAENFWSVEHFEMAEKTEFFDSLPEVAENVTLISIESALDKRRKSSKYLMANTKVETFEPLEEAEITEWIIRTTQDRGGNILQKDARFLLHRAGADMWNLDQEITKLLTASGDQTITQPIIESLTVPNPQMVIWNFLESLSRKQTVKAIEQFRSLMAMGESTHQIFAMIIREIRIHTQLVAGMAQGLSGKPLAQAAGLHPFVVQKTAPLSRNFTLPQLEGLYDELLKIDTRLKTGGIVVTTDDQGEFQLALEKFIVRATV